MKPIYLDHHATTPMAPEVFDAMKPYFMEEFGNASSKNHSYGWRADKAVEASRSTVAKLLGVHSREVTFTSGATESNNLALMGVAESYKNQGNHIITSAIEHKSVLDCCKELQTRGFEVTYLPVNRYGQISLDELEEAITDKTILVSIQMANNEVGTIQPLREISKILKSKNVFFHSDITQAISTLHTDVNELGIDLASLSAHKFYGPKGIGALYIKSLSPRIKLKPLFFGGGHERGLRSGTLNVPGIVGMAKASELALQNRTQDCENLKLLRDELESTLKKLLNIKVHGHPTERLPHNLNFSIDRIENVSEFLKNLPHLALSTGAACSINSIEPSHVLQAMGLSLDEISKTLRIGLGRANTKDDLEQIPSQIAQLFHKLS